MTAVSTMAAAQRLVAQGFLSLGDVEISLESVGAHIVFVSVYRLPLDVSEEALVQVLTQYGKVKAINHATFRDCPDVKTGTRVVNMDMSKPVPIFVHIQGHRVMVDYCGLRRVCSQCRLEGHIGHACKTPCCNRCVFRHATAGYTAPCLRCGHSHATTDCIQRSPTSLPLSNPGRSAHDPRSELSPPLPSQPPRIPVLTRTRPSAHRLHHLPLLSGLRSVVKRRSFQQP